MDSGHWTSGMRLIWFRLLAYSSQALQQLYCIICTDQHAGGTCRMPNPLFTCSMSYYCMFTDRGIICSLPGDRKCTFLWTQAKKFDFYCLLFHCTQYQVPYSLSLIKELSSILRKLFRINYPNKTFHQVPGNATNESDTLEHHRESTESCEPVEPADSLVYVLIGRIDGKFNGIRNFIHVKIEKTAVLFF